MKLNIKKRIVTALSAAMALCVCAVSAFASGDPVDVTSTLTSSFQTVINDLLQMISAILPIGLTVFGASMAIAFGIKWFKKLIGKA